MIADRALYPVTTPDVHLAPLVQPEDRRILLSFLAGGSLSSRSLADRRFCDRVVEVNIDSRSALAAAPFLSSFRNLECVSLQKNLGSYAWMDELDKLVRVSVGENFKEWEKLAKSRPAFVGKRKPTEVDLSAWARMEGLREVSLTQVDLELLAGRDLGPSIIEVGLHDGRGDTVDLRSSSHVSRVRATYCAKLERVASRSLRQLFVQKCPKWGSAPQELPSLEWLVTSSCASADVGQLVRTLPALRGIKMRGAKFKGEVKALLLDRPNLRSFFVDGWRPAKSEGSELSLQLPGRLLANGLCGYENGRECRYTREILPKELNSLDPL